jgi:hypothetical protein
VTLLDDLDRRRERANRDAENSARLAQAYAVFTTEGQGTNQFEERVSFGLTFVEKPIVGYASMCDIEELADILEVDVEEVPLPVCAGYVTHWDQDERDFYTGCWIAARVSFPSLDLVDVQALPIIEHHFTFSAIGMKDIPPNMEDETE